MNKLIGDKEIKLGSTTLVCRPDFTALARIESMTGKSAVELNYEYAEMKPRISDIAAVVWCTHKSYDPKNKLKLTDVGQMVCNSDFADVSTNAIEMISYVLNGGEEGKKKESESENPPATLTPVS